MLIREVTMEDIPKLVELYQKFWGQPSHIEKMQRQFWRLKDQNSHIILCAVAGNSFMGSVIGIVCADLYGDCRPFMVLENLIVDKQHRRKGVAQQLLGELEGQAQKRHCTQIILVTEKNRLDACGFYQASGFQLDNAGYKKKP